MRILLLFLVVFLSCEGEKVQFVESKAIKGLVLVKNLFQSPDKVKKAIIEYIKNQKGKDFMEFYEYSSSTKAFIESKRVGGYLREYIHHYQEQNGIGVFYIGKCKEDTSEQVGIIRYYEKYGNFYEPDTIIGECRNKKAF